MAGAAAFVALTVACGEEGTRPPEKRTSDFPVVDRLKAPGRGLVDLTYAQGYLWVADAEAPGVIYRFLPSTGSVLSSVNTGYGPPGAIASDGNYLYVAAAETGDVYQHNLSARCEELAHHATGLADVRALYCDGGKFYVFDQATAAFYEYDGDWELVASYAVGPGEEWLRGAGRFHERLWSADNRGGWLNRHRADNFDVEEKYCTPGWHAAGIAWDGTYLYSGDTDARRIYKLDVSAAP